MQHPNRSPQRYSFAKFETCDAGLHGQCLTGWDHVYEQVERRPFRASVTELWLGPMQLFREQINQSVAYRGTSWSGSLLFFSPMPSPGNTILSGRSVEHSAITALPQNFLQNGFCNGPTDSIAVAIDHAFLSDFSERELGRDVVAESVGRGLWIVDPRAVGLFRKNAVEILDEVSAQPDCVEDACLREGLSERLLRVLLQLLEHKAFETQLVPHPSTRSYIVDKAVQYMDAHLADPMVISDVCAAVRVCPRTLRYSFEDIVGVSPTQYLLARRLSCVRRELMQAGSSSRVYCIAQRYGFSHMGRFAQFYGSAFGERPSDTSRRADVLNSYAFRAVARNKSNAVHRAA